MLVKLFNSKVFLYVVICSIATLFFLNNKRMSDKIDILKSNQYALLENSSAQIELNKRDFERIYRKEDSIARSVLGIKPKDITNVIVSNYHYKDTNIYTYPIDSSSDTTSFIHSINCYKVEGFVSDKQIVFTKSYIDDKLHTFIFKKYDKKFLFVKWNKYYDAAIYSECMNDTISVEKNIKIK